MDFSEYLFRCHMVGKIIDINKPLTKNQDLTLKGLRDKGFNNLTVPQTKNISQSF